MRVRSIDANGDWNFGKGRNDYKSAKDEIMQSLQTRIKSFLGDCFFAREAGIDWFNLLGAKDVTELSLAVSATILNTEGVTGIVESSIAIDKFRNIKLVYQVETVYGRSQRVILSPEV